MAQLVARPKEVLKLTPDMKLVYPLPAPAPSIEVSLLEHAHKLMNVLQGVWALH